MKTSIINGSEVSRLSVAIHVAVNEPPDNSELIMKLTELPNFILTPHISWASTEAIHTHADIMVDNINTFYN